ncbi:hypothetical protein OKW12_004366 [Pseudomonas silensiensis]|nr:hypothetical protein [Pseudomonas silensiensis]
MPASATQITPIPSVTFSPSSPPSTRQPCSLTPAKPLASLNVMTTDLACDLEGSRRNVALAIQQLAVLGELLVNRALDNLDPPNGVSEVSSARHH